MSYQAYRRLLSNIRLTGRWEFCRKRNTWSTERDYTRQVLQPDSEVHVYQCAELRILDDEPFLALQAKLKELQIGPRGPRKPREPKLPDLVTDIFHCPHCQRRFHVCGSHGQSMRCPNLDCPTPAMVRRDEAVSSLCGKLTELLTQHPDVVEQIVAATQRLDARSVDAVEHAAAEVSGKSASAATGSMT